MVKGVYTVCIYKPMEPTADDQYKSMYRMATFVPRTHTILPYPHVVALTRTHFTCARRMRRRRNADSNGDGERQEDTSNAPHELQEDAEEPLLHTSMCSMFAAASTQVNSHVISFSKRMM